MKQENLIFLISQPRSGSTLTQKILGAHSKVYTRSEPWIMLNQLSQFKQDDSYEKYDKSLENIGVNDFISELPNGKQDYLYSIRNMYLSLYNLYLQKEDKQYFLDKTPRYYLIINELKEVFPDAKFIFLKRNPLAVLSSIINTWHGDNLYNLSNHRADLIEAIDKIIEASNEDQSQGYSFLYEDLLKNENKTLKNIFEYIGIDFEKNVLNYNQNKTKKWCFGDPQNVYEKSSIDSNNDTKWTKDLDNLQYWRILHDYLQYLGKEKFEKFGYSFNENLEILKQNMPCKTLIEVENKTTSLFDFWGHAKNEDRLKQRNKQLKQKDQQLKQKDQQLKQKDQQLKQKDQQLKQKDQQLEQKDQQLEQKQSKIITLLNNPWYRFGQLSRKEKIWTSGKILSKKMKIHWALESFAQVVKKNEK